MRNTSNCTLRITKSTPKKPCCSSEKTDKEAALQTLRQRFPCVRPMPRRGGINARLAYDFFRFLKRPLQDRHAARQSSSKPLCKDLHEWLKLERLRVPEGSATAKAIAYSLNRWDALTAYLDNGAVQIDNNHIENLVRPWAMGRKAWLFAGSELAGQRAAVVMSLLQSAKLHGHDPWAYLKDVLTRLPGHINSRIDELLPHRWQPQS